MMSEILNSIIKFDLHIHSAASTYKENAGIVDNSTKDNLATLLSNLNKNNVALFSITDHNRFDPCIYEEIHKILYSPDNPYANVKSVLAGVEFDVKIEEQMEKCHIIAIFDTNCESSKLVKINESIQNNLLTNPSDAYSKDAFEVILKNIGLNTILIASQRKNIHDHSGNHNSLSDSTNDVEQIIRLGYIDALEFQKPRVEGILLNNLKEISLPMPLFSGSDCHDWACYPYHDSKNKNTEFHHSKAKILPTFKGLLMAVTSPETRFNCCENSNKDFVTGISINDTPVPLVNGINAIIGENGAGKTTIIKLLNGKFTEKHVKDLVRNNALKRNNEIPHQAVKYIEQGQIINRFNTRTLFTAGEETNFKNLDHAPFCEAYSSFARELKKGIELSIGKQEVLASLVKFSIEFQENMTVKNYHVDITGSKTFEGVNNPHDNARKSLKSLIDSLNVMLADDYFGGYKNNLESALRELSSIQIDVENKWRSVEHEAAVKNIIHGCVDDYLRKVKANSSSQAKEIKDYNDKRQLVIDSVVNTINIINKDIAWPNAPCSMQGVTRNPKHGFYFNRESMYNGVSMVSAFFSSMFLNAYESMEKLVTIKTYEDFSRAVRNCTSSADIDQKWKENLQKFLDESTKTNDRILEGADQQIGNTLGEMSLSYYKFFTQDGQNWSVLIVDQPEDNISNNNISKKLLGYFNAIRDEKQIIFVTHNPLLVVNLDVDNVVFIKNDNGLLSVSSGCLEHEDADTNILKLIADNMDGGKETIEKRLKVYG
jgi:adenylate kinase family enzyme